ncbi:hypothetical protein STEG23_033484, partial [Scotinomys teguina]
MARTVTSALDLQSKVTAAYWEQKMLTSPQEIGPHRCGQASEKNKNGRQWSINVQRRSQKTRSAELRNN